MFIRSLADFNGALGGPVTGWHRHRHRPGPTLLVDTTSEGWGLLSGWPPAGTYTWPSAGTFPWPWTACAAHADRFDGSEWRDVGPLDDAAGAELDDRRARWATALAGKG